MNDGQRGGAGCRRGRNRWAMAWVANRDTSLGLLL